MSTKNPGYKKISLLLACLSTVLFALPVVAQADISAELFDFVDAYVALTGPASLTRLSVEAESDYVRVISIDLEPPADPDDLNEGEGLDAVVVTITPGSGFDITDLVTLGTEGYSGLVLMRDSRNVELEWVEYETDGEGNVLYYDGDGNLVGEGEGDPNIINTGTVLVTDGEFDFETDEAVPLADIIWDPVTSTVRMVLAETETIRTAPDDEVYFNLPYEITTETTLTNVFNGGDLYLAFLTSRTIEYRDTFSLDIESDGLVFNMGDPSVPVTGSALISGNGEIISRIPTFLNDVTEDGQELLQTGEPVAVVGIDVSDAGYNEFLRFVNVEFEPVTPTFTTEDLAHLTTDENSGVALYMDNGTIDGFFDLDDTLVPLGFTPTFGSASGFGSSLFSVSLYPDVAVAIPDTNEDEDAGNDFFVVLRASGTIDAGDSFIVTVGPSISEFLQPSEEPYFANYINSIATDEFAGLWSTSDLGCGIIEDEDPVQLYCGATEKTVTTKAIVGTSSLPPTIQVLQPPLGGVDVDDTLTIVWEDSDPDSDAAIALYFDTDDEGFDGALITTVNEDPDGVGDTYDLNTSTFEEGTYWIYAVIDDGVNPPVYDYSDGPFRVTHDISVQLVDLVLPGQKIEATSPPTPVLEVSITNNLQPLVVNQVTVQMNPVAGSVDADTLADFIPEGILESPDGLHVAYSGIFMTANDDAVIVADVEWDPETLSINLIPNEALLIGNGATMVLRIIITTSEFLEFGDQFSFTIPENGIVTSRETFPDTITSGELIANVPTILSNMVYSGQKISPEDGKVQMIGIDVSDGNNGVDGNVTLDSVTVDFVSQIAPISSDSGSISLYPNMIGNYTGDPNAVFNAAFTSETTFIIGIYSGNIYEDFSTIDATDEGAGIFISALAWEGLAQIDDQMTIRFGDITANRFTPNDLLPLTAGEDSGVALYRDNGDGIFNPAFDDVVPLAFTPEFKSLSSLPLRYAVTLVPATPQSLPVLLDGSNDFFIAVEASPTITIDDAFSAIIAPFGNRLAAENGIVYSAGNSTEGIVSSPLASRTNAKPSFAFVSPPEGGETATDSYIIRWLDEDADSSATISLYYGGKITSISESNPDTDIVLVLDRSFSMDGQPLADLKTAASNLVDSLSDAIQIAVISFGNDAELLQDFTNDPVALKQAINSLTPYGRTNTEAAIKLANQVIFNGSTQPNKRVIMISDGEPTEGGSGSITPTQAALDAAEDSVDLGIRIDTFGYNIAKNSDAEYFMEQVASITGGEYFFAPTGSELNSLLQVTVSTIEVRHLIAEGIDEDSDGYFFDIPGDYYIWDLSGLQNGEYTIFAKIEDGSNLPVYVKSLGKLTITNSKPSISILEPDGVNDIADSSFLIKWTDYDFDDNASIDLYADPDTISDNGNEILLAEDIAEDPDLGPPNYDSYLWDTRVYENGKQYYIYATISDGINFNDAYSIAPVIIDHSQTVFTYLHDVTPFNMLVDSASENVDVIGINIIDGIGGGTGTKTIDSITVNIIPVSGTIDKSDFSALSGSAELGAPVAVTIYQDAPGGVDGIFDANDIPMAVNWGDFGDDLSLEVIPQSGLEVPDDDSPLNENSGPDYFITIATSSTIDYGDAFKVEIPEYGIILSSGAIPQSITTRTITANLPTEFEDLIGAGGANLQTLSAPLPLLGINVRDSGYLQRFQSLTIYMESYGGDTDFNQFDLRPMSTDRSSGLALYRDDGTEDGVFDDNDTLVSLIDTPTWQDGFVRFYIANGGAAIPDSDSAEDAGNDFYLVARGGLNITDGDDFRVFLIENSFTFSSGRARLREPFVTGIVAGEEITPTFPSFFDLSAGNILENSGPVVVMGININEPDTARTLNGLTVQFENRLGFLAANDLAALDGTANSGIAIYRDVDAGQDGVFEPGVDAPVDGTWDFIDLLNRGTITFTVPQTLPADDTTVGNKGVDFYVVIRSSMLIETGDRFAVTIPMDGMDFSSVSYFDTFTTGDIIATNQIPDSPSNLTAEQRKAGGIFLSWDPASAPDLAGYKIYSNNGSGSINYAVPVASVDTDTLEVTVENLSHNVTYTFGVRSFDLVGQTDLNTTLIVSQVADAQGPQTPSIVINGGQSQTSIDLVTLNLSATDDPDQMQINATGTFSSGAWQNYQTSQTYALSGLSANAQKSVYAVYRDFLENESAIVSDSIQFVVPSVVINNGEDASGHNYTVFSDIVLHITARGATEMEITTGSFTGNFIPFSDTVNYTLPSGTGNYTVRVRFKNEYGNVSNSVIAQDTVEVLSVGLTLNDGASSTNFRNVALDFLGAGIDQVRVGETSNLSGIPYQPVETVSTFLMSEGAGLKTLYAQFKVDDGRESSVISRSITYLPISVSLVGSEYVSTPNISLSISAYLDAASMVFSGDVQSPTGIVPMSSNVNVTLTYNPSLTFQERNIEVYLISDLGIMSDVFSFSIFIDQEGPDTPTLVITPREGIKDEGEKVTWFNTVSLVVRQNPSSETPTEMNIVDATGIADENIVFSSSNWQPFDALLDFNLTSGAGEKKIAILFRDSLGNVSEEPSIDTVILEVPGLLVNNGNTETNVNQIEIAVTDGFGDGSALADEVLISRKSNFSDVDPETGWQELSDQKKINVALPGAFTGQQRVYVRLRTIGDDETLLYTADLNGQIRFVIPAIRLVGGTYSNSEMISLGMISSETESNGEPKLLDVTYYTVEGDVQNAGIFFPYGSTGAATIRATGGEGINTFSFRFKDEFGNETPAADAIEVSVLVELTPEFEIIAEDAEEDDEGLITRDPKVKLKFIPLSQTPVDVRVTGQAERDLEEGQALDSSGFGPYKPIINVTLTSGDGNKDVTVEYRDKAGLISLPSTESIFLLDPIVSPDSGRVLSLRNGTTLTLEAGAVDREMKIILKELDVNSSRFDPIDGQAPVAAYAIDTEETDENGGGVIPEYHFLKVPELSINLDGVVASPGGYAIYYWNGYQWFQRNTTTGADSLATKTRTSGIYGVFPADSQGINLTITRNPFTPNNDGYNDEVRFIIEGVGGETGTIKIFDRRGREVRTLQDVSDEGSWDGRDNKGEPMPGGWYLFEVKIGDLKKSGSIGLVR